MLGSESRARLRGLVERLKVMRSRLPERAEAFHAATRGLEERIGRLERRWWKPWPTLLELERLEAPARELDQLVLPLGELIKRADALTEQVDALEPLSGRLGDPRLEEWLRSWITTWRAELEAAGRRSPDLYFLDAERERFGAREAELRHASQLCYQLAKAAELLRAPEPDDEGRALARELEELRRAVAEELRHSPPTTEQAERLKAGIQPLERRVATRIENRGRLEGLGERLQELRGWSRRLGDRERPRIDRLEERRQELAFAPPDDRGAVERWLAEADELLTALTAAAREERRNRLEQLENAMLELAEACGRQPAAEEQIAELRALPVARHQEHAEWLQRLDRHQTDFQSTAKIHERELEQRLGEQVQRLQGTLRELLDGALAGPDREDYDRLDHELGVLRRVSGVSRSLHGLRQVKEVEVRVEGLARRLALQKQRLGSLESRRSYYRRALAKLDPASLTPSERVDVEQIRRELTRRRRRDGGAAQMAQIEELIKKCELLFERLRRDEILAGRRREELLARLRRFDEELLRRYCPELAERVEALLHGVPSTPRRWRGALHQLERVSELLERLERSCRRLAAAELEQAVALLRDRPESRRDHGLSVLLETLDGWDPHELPPATLRMQARHEADRITEVR